MAEVPPLRSYHVTLSDERDEAKKVQTIEAHSYDIGKPSGWITFYRQQEEGNTLPIECIKESLVSRIEDFTHRK